MDYDSSLGFPSEADIEAGTEIGEKLFTVVMSEFPNFRPVGTNDMEATAQFETLRYLDTIPYSLAVNRD